MDKDNFNIVDMFSSKESKARIILVFYAVIIVALIIFIRVGNSGSKTNNDNNTDIDENVSENINQDDNYNDTYQYTKDDYEDDNSLYNRFSFLNANNYSFEIEINYDKNVVISGIRYNNKYKMTVNDKTDNKTIDYLTKNGVAKAFYDGEYKEVNMPVTLIDYFNNNNLYNILHDSELVKEDNNEVMFTISDKKLKKYLLDDFSNFLDGDGNNKNEINIKLKNNKIYEIHFNIHGSYGEKTSKNAVILSLKYDKYAQIDDFDVVF